MARNGVRLAVLGVGAAMIAAVSAEAATLMKVRVGNHPDKTRVVLETDGAADYRVASRAGDEIVVRLDADAVPEAIAGNGAPLLWVRVEPRVSGTDIRLQIGSAVTVKEMVLEGPDRIVLDLVPGAAPVAVAPAPAPAPEVVVEPEPEPVAFQEPEPTEPTAEPDPFGEAAPEPASLAEETGLEPLAPGDPTGDPLVGSLPGDPDADAGVVAAPVPEPAPDPAPSAVSPPVQRPARPSGALAVLRNPLVLGAGGLVLALFLFRAVRRRSATVDEDDAVADGSVAPHSADATTGSIAAAFAQSEGAEAPSSATEGGASIFDVDEAEVVAAEDTAAREPTITGATSAAPLDTSELGDDMAEIVKELERRMAHFETRLEEVSDAKERLERQVAAQTEELRVQRAAIARTQRVLRGISRDDEASEPVPK